MISKRTVLLIMNSAFFVVTLPSQQGKQGQKSTDTKGTKQRMTIGDITECHWDVFAAFLMLLTLPPILVGKREFL